MLPRGHYRPLEKLPVGLVRTFDSFYHLLVVQECTGGKLRFFIRSSRRLSPFVLGDIPFVETMNILSTTVRVSKYAEDLMNYLPRLPSLEVELSFHVFHCGINRRCSVFGDYLVFEFLPPRVGDSTHDPVFVKIIGSRHI